MFDMYQQLPVDGLRDIGRGAAESLSYLGFLVGLPTPARSSDMLDTMTYHLPRSAMM